VRVVIEDKEQINECKKYLKDLLKNSNFFYTMASDDDMDSIIDSAIDACWFFVGKIRDKKEFELLKENLKKKLPRKSDGRLYDLYDRWGNMEYGFIISEAMLAINEIKSRHMNDLDNDEYEGSKLDDIIKNK
jgi:hypothetical protein